MNYYYYNLLSAKKDPSKPTQNEVGKQTLMLGLLTCYGWRQRPAPQ